MNRWGTKGFLLCVLLMSANACGSEETPRDSGLKDAQSAECDGDLCVQTGSSYTADSGQPNEDSCKVDSDCDDGVYCNPEKICSPDSEQADVYGCVVINDGPCGDRECDEDRRQCNCNNPDADNDGDDAIECGGSDCDDSDPKRRAGNVEECDEEGHDEDCDLATIGGPADSDKDKDGYTSVLCCNLQENGDNLCGDDCDDELSGINPGQVEACNDGVDDNCDGIIDGIVVDGDLKVAYYKDKDGDGFGVTDSELVQCSPPEVEGDEQWVESKGDCADDSTTNPNAAAINPGADEDCNLEIDNNCSGTINEGCTCVGKITRPCGPNYQDGSPVPGLVNESDPRTEGECERGEQPCLDGTWSDQCIDFVAPTIEICNDLDDDCDAEVDEDASDALDWVLDEDGDSHGVPGSSEKSCDRPTVDHSQSSSDDDCVDDPDENSNANVIYPGQDENCNGYDDNCDGLTDGVYEDFDQQNIFYRNADGDTQGDANETIWSCASEPPDGYDDDDNDCNDTDSSIYLGATELCNGVDDDCDQVDDSEDSDASSNCELTGQINSAICDVDHCAVDQCIGAYLDCDSVFDCEVNGATDMSHCGACENSCLFSCNSSDCDEIVSLSAGYNHTCAATIQGRLACWGYNGYNQASTSADDTISEPSLVQGVSEVDMVAAGTDHTCVIEGASNSIACFGSNESKQLGAGTTESISAAPVTIIDSSNDPLTGATSIAAGRAHNCAAFNDGSARCWGERDYGQIGNGSTSDGTVQNPAQVRISPGVYIDDIAQVVAGGSHSCARTDDGEVYCWGDNSAGQLGVGAAPTESGNALLVSISDVSMLAAGMAHTCALSAGSVSCWGLNTNNQVGQPSGAVHFTPQTYSEFSDAVAIATGGTFTCARRTGGTVSCWGSNISGERGDEAPASASASPVTISDLTADFLTAGGSGYACAIATSGQGVCWGSNLSSQFGDGGTQSTHLPQDIMPLSVP